ncbi:CDP-glycerol glycerophosphotransferase family protein [soil metagenome]
MPLIRDAKTVLRLARRLLTARSHRAEVARRSKEFARPAPASVDVLVYFADTRVNLYQLRQWYAPLAALAEKYSVAILSRSPGAALALLEESTVPVLYRPTVREIEELVAEQEIKVVLYVNQNAKNFQMFRYNRMWHVFINHGESDKMYMTTNQFKAYDYALVAGPAARDRLSHKLWDFDIDKRAIMIGRPQADHFVGELPYPQDERTVILYAPTWEGDRAAAAYGSVASHGEALVAAVLASPRHRLVYRPHPRSGVLHADYKRANRAIISAIAAANAKDPSAHHVFDDGPQLGWQLAAADVAITDVSAMVYDRLATGKPIIVTRPVSPEADLDLDGYLGAAEWLDAAEAGDVLALAERVSSDPEAKARLDVWVSRHFGDTSPGEATRRFHAAIDTLVAEWHRQDALHAGDRRTREPDPFEGDAPDE